MLTGHDAKTHVKSNYRCHFIRGAHVAPVPSVREPPLRGGGTWVDGQPGPPSPRAPVGKYTKLSCL